MWLFFLPILIPVTACQLHINEAGKKKTLVKGWCN